MGRLATMFRVWGSRNGLWGAGLEFGVEGPRAFYPAAPFDIERHKSKV